MWTDEQLEEMGLYDSFVKALFLSGCGKHWANLSDCQGYVASEEKLQEFVRLIIEEHEKSKVDNMRVVYYIKHPNGREKIVPIPTSDEAAVEAFKKHWTATANWRCNGKRVLVKEVKQEIYVEEINAL